MWRGVSTFSGGCLPDSGGFEPPNPPENPSMVYQYIVPNEIGQTMRVRDPNCMKFYCSSIYDILLYKAVKISNKFNERFLVMDSQNFVFLSCSL